MYTTEGWWYLKRIYTIWLKFKFTCITGLEVKVKNSGPSDLGSSIGWGDCVLVLSKTLHSRTACLHPGMPMDTGRLLGQAGIPPTGIRTKH